MNTEINKKYDNLFYYIDCKNISFDDTKGKIKIKLEDDSWEEDLMINSKYKDILKMKENQQYNDEK
jgi:hypothetical protein